MISSLMMRCDSKVVEYEDKGSRPDDKNPVVARKENETETRGNYVIEG
jgi:hypothetical protein